MTTGNKKVSELFSELIELRYSEFRQMELAVGDVTNRGDLLVKLARAARRKKGGLRAIQEVLNRLDGKVAVQVEVEYPKFYMVFPRAESVEGGDRALPEPEVEAEIEARPKKVELTPGSLREVVDKLLDRPKMERLQIIKAADEIDEYGHSEFGNPKLKSVIAAGLYDLMDYNMGAIYELLEQIEGKVADKIKVLGDDIYINNYSLVAPAGAVKNEKGVYQVSMDNTTSSWAARLGSES